MAMAFDPETIKPFYFTVLPSLRMLSQESGTVSQRSAKWCSRKLSMKYIMSFVNNDPFLTNKKKKVLTILLLSKFDSDKFLLNLTNTSTSICLWICLFSLEP